MSSIDGDVSDDELGNNILDLEVFDQLISMDDEDDEFSQQIVYNYFEQAETTFSNMDKAIKARDLARLSELGHFLKGSSASIGVKRVRDCCEHIQHLGRLKNTDGEGQVDEETALEEIVKELEEGKKEYQKAKEFLRFFYEQDDDDE
ncbi:Phosphorelay intermediate protein [Linderina macrospora]|uniref:Phosphorelay intermediate protein n=1 Tax=Linderina macrospora TaxID=4868 RepID=A0ACC1J965_9FUNG|nr:Phosphorelay intermediate protein [Linderina macrospora]